MGARNTLSPIDEHNQSLLDNVYPEDWQNPVPDGRYNMVVIGGGTAGLVSAAGAAGLGAKVALVERNLLGGDCLNVGCVPSKCLIRSGRAAADIRHAGDLGVEVKDDGWSTDFSRVMQRLRRVRAGISGHDSAARFSELGVDVFLGDARFTSGSTVEVAGRTLEFRKAVIAAGTHPFIPPIKGIGDVDYLTNDTVFNLTERPDRLACIGAGPIGSELAQAFARLGAKVTLFESGDRILRKEDPEASMAVEEAFAADGIELVKGCRVRKVERVDGGLRVHYGGDDETDSVDVDKVLIATGRVPNVDGLGLEAAGVRCDEKTGVLVDDRLRTSNRNIFAAGDICLKHKFTHAADASARLVIRNALFFGRGKASDLVIPRCTYTDPEVATVGLTRSEADQAGIEVDTFDRRLSDVDRAMADGETQGHVRIHVKKGKDEIVGATIVAGHAGEMIGELTLAMVKGISLGQLSGVIHPYPTQAEAVKQTADAYYRTKLTPTVKSLFQRWLAWTR